MNFPGRWHIMWPETIGIYMSSWRMIEDWHTYSRSNTTNIFRRNNDTACILLVYDLKCCGEVDASRLVLLSPAYCPSCNSIRIANALTIIIFVFSQSTHDIVKSRTSEVAGHVSHSAFNRILSIVICVLSKTIKESWIISIRNWPASLYSFSQFTKRVTGLDHL